MELKDAVGRVRLELYKAEEFADEDADLSPGKSAIEYARYLDRVETLAEKRTPECLREFHTRLTTALDIFAQAIPDPGNRFLTAPVCDVMPNLGVVVERMSQCFFGDSRLFDRLRTKIHQNASRLGGSRPSQCDRPHEYFAGTPLRWLFEAQIPIGFPEERRFEGQWVVARQGAGKTNLLCYQILRDMDAVARGEACVVVIDVTGTASGQIISNVIRHKRFGPGGDLHGKLIYVDPSDKQVVPINLMATGVDIRDENAVSTATASMLAMIGSLMEQPLTRFQDPVFRAVVQLAMVMERPTLATLREILAPGSTVYLEHAHKLRPELRDYFRTTYDTERVRSSRMDVLSRIHSLTMDDAFSRVFAHEETKLDFGIELNKPQVIVINCDRNELQTMTQLFGRFYFGRIIAALAGRAKIPRSQRLPTYIYFDEASEIIADDPNAAFLLFKFRQMNAGLTVGMQDSTHAQGEARRAYFSTAIKFVNSNSDTAKEMSADMNCERNPGFLMNRPAGNFAFFVTGAMGAPIGVQVPEVINRGGWKNEPMMSWEEFRRDVMPAIRDRFYVWPAKDQRRHNNPPEMVDDTAVDDSGDDTPASPGPRRRRRGKQDFDNPQT